MNRSWNKLIENSKQRAAERMMLSTKEPQNRAQGISVDIPVSEYLAKIERKNGKKGSPAGPHKLSPKRKK